jgi:EAL domain-containing protein (putative c-di-GMP-specific phosphodiesterase class I)
MHLRRSPRHPAAVTSRRSLSLFGTVEMVLQPIVSVSSGSLIGAEALARFPCNLDSPVTETFALAHATGRGPELEAACLRAALRKRMTDVADDIVLTVNVSPDALAHPSVQSALECDLAGLVIEVTEHAAGDIVALQRALDELRERGAQIAIDDASTGYAGLLRLTALRPDIVKLDRGLVTGAWRSEEQAAVIEALVSLSHRIGARVLGEGVETLDDLTALAELDVDLAQGFYIAPPMASLPDELPDAMESCRIARGKVLGNDLTTVPEWPTSGIRSVTAALAASVQPADLEAALAAASSNLGIDIIALSALTPGEVLREISCAGDAVDGTAYPLADYPATRAALDTGRMTEAHLEDALSDAAERRIMQADGIASLLLTPIIGRGTRLGILEFRHRSHRRWTAHDMNQARILAEHIASVLLRMPNVQPVAAALVRKRPTVAVAS